MVDALSLQLIKTAAEKNSNLQFDYTIYCTNNVGQIMLYAHIKEDIYNIAERIELAIANKYDNIFARVLLDI